MSGGMEGSESENLVRVWDELLGFSVVKTIR